MSPFSHLDANGRVRMVDVSAKAVTVREAVARGRVTMAPGTLRELKVHGGPKGNALTTAHLAGVMAAKRAGEWIPLAHPLQVDAVDVAFGFVTRPAAVTIECRVRTTGRTGVEMEALTAVAAAALTLVDMLKALDRTLVIGDIALWEKRGGRTGEWLRPTGKAAGRAAGGAANRKTAGEAPRLETGAEAPGRKAPARTRARRHAR